MTTERLTAEAFWKDKEKDLIDAIGLKMMLSDKLYLPYEVWEFMEAFARQEVEAEKAELDKTSYLLGIEDGRKMERAEIEKRMPTGEQIIDMALEYVKHKSLKTANKGLIKDALIIGADWFRSQMKGENK